MATNRTEEPPMHEGHGYLFDTVMRRLSDLSDDATDEQVRTRERPAQGLGEPGAQYGDERFWAVYERIRGQGCTPKGALAHAYIDVQMRAQAPTDRPVLGSELGPGDAVLLIREPEGNEDPAVALPPRVPLWYVLGEEIRVPPLSRRRRFHLVGGGRAEIVHTAFYASRRSGTG
jgi:hypothetical protein